MDGSILEKHFKAVPEVSLWPELASLFENQDEEPNPDWFLPLKICKAVGGNPVRAEPIATAIACLQVSIILVDDMLDEDPVGEYRKIGPGKAANIALGLEAAAFQLVERSDASDAQKAAIANSLSWMSLATARGQHMDVENVGDEADYWKVVSAKSTPFYGSAVEVGGIIGGATPEVCRHLHEMGVLMGEIVQLHDDLFDAFAKPAKPDWERPQNNLLMLYVITADHDDREEFSELSGRVADPGTLERAQEILIRSGAVSFCAYQLMQRYQKLNKMTQDLEIPNPDELKELFELQFQPAMMLLEKVGAELPPDLFM